MLDPMDRDGSLALVIGTAQSRQQSHIHPRCNAVCGMQDGLGRDGVGDA